MQPRILLKKELNKTVSNWMKSCDVIAPVSSQEGVSFKVISHPNEINLEAQRKPVYPPKSVFLPQSETLFKYSAGDYVMPEQPARQKILFGTRPCDARAMGLLDTVFKTATDMDLYWAEKREKTLVISFGCATMCQTGFCDTVGSGPFGQDGSDILVTDLEDRLLFEPLTAPGEAFAKKMLPAEETDSRKAEEIQSASLAKTREKADLGQIREKLYASFNSPIWKDISASCLGCGVCTYLCPTCFCFDIVDEVERGERVRNWDTCMFRIYSQEASGHNPRPGKAERTRQRLMHKFAYWVDNENLSGCTGCGRCVEQCPVNLDIREMIETITSLSIQ